MTDWTAHFANFFAEQAQRPTADLERRRGRPPRAEHPASRDELVEQRYLAGETAQAIGDDLGLTRERICQILRRKNIIEHKAERNREAKAALASELAAIKAEARSQLNRLVEQGARLVEDGASVSAAAAEVGIKPYVLLHHLNRLGVKSRHGRWRDYSDRERRVRELRAEGKTWAEVESTLHAEGDRQWVYSWVIRHCPDLIKPQKARTDATRRRGIPNDIA